tara:strand:+ start:4725 stop:6317 length:1593 start_codon:yes stop_codon:yes gene_type:complete
MEPVSSEKLSSEQIDEESELIRLLYDDLINDKQNVPIALRKGTRARNRPNRLDPSCTGTPKKKEKVKRIKLKLEHFVKTKLNKKARNAEPFSRHKHKNLNWKRGEKPNSFAVHAAWLKKFKQLQNDPIFQDRSRNIVENFKKTHMPIFPWNPEYTSYENLLISGIKKAISKGEGYSIQLIKKVHEDIETLCRNTFPFGTTTYSLANETQKLSETNDKFTLNIDDILTNTYPNWDILQKLKTAFGELPSTPEPSSLGPSSLEPSEDFRQSSSFFENPCDEEVENFHDIITEKDMQMIDGMKVSEVQELEKKFRDLGYDIDDTNEYTILESAETTSVPMKHRFHPYRRTSRTGMGIKKPKISRTTLKKMLPKVFKSKQTKSKQTKANKPKPQKGGTRKKNPKKPTRRRRKPKRRAGAPGDRKPPRLPDISIGKYYDEHSKSFKEIPGINTSRKIQSRHNNVILSYERDKLMRQLNKLIQEMPKQNESQHPNSQITLQRLALEISSLDKKLKKNSNSPRTLSGGTCPSEQCLN